jgi:tight adherence protein C
MTVSPLLAGLLAMAACAIGLAGVPLLRDRGPLDRLVARVDAAPAARRRSVVVRMIERLAAKLGPLLAPTLRARGRHALDRKLDLAGRPGAMTVQRFIGLKAAITATGGGIMLLFALGGSPPFLLLVAVVICWFGPDIWLAREGRLRQERIQRDLPDFMDILAVTVRAGLGYRAALQRVAEALSGPVSEEMLTALRQMDLGASRRDAFLAMAARNSSDALTSMVSAQLQAEELGVPLSEALNEIAEDMRRASHQEARRRAARAAPRISLIVTTVIVPGAMILILMTLFLSSDVGDSGLLGGGG